MSKEVSTVCELSHCDRETHARDWCRRHYAKWRRHGDPNHGRDYQRNKGRTCSKSGCEKDAYARGKCANHYNRQRKPLQKWLYEGMKRGPCTDCGQTFHPVCMDFDHQFGEKVSGVGQLVEWCSTKSFLDEVSKCELVCANCHRLRTYEQ